MEPSDEGKAYFLEYGEKYENPYPRGIYEHNEFERGWSQALKARPDLLKKHSSTTKFNRNGTSAEDYKNARKK
ncbi:MULTISPECIES: hypothetical protein [unclassified Methylophaga]|uniref:hypothetical protein n=1 Tax=unclassified Methylophaga TaxID=2629249 RepID=UPI000C9575F5|nr:MULTISPECIES: hypothetical protein [unclassified Methylophaga]MBN45198.1 hypothetical protein [Methylophaga sp.]|tara:strand:+ start:90660 stop:90878 length:219 start_codon:yes stop_codon:yes gene_type:complete